MKSWIIELERDSKTGDVILPLSDAQLKELGWEIGDTLEWIDNKNGTWTIQLKKPTLLTKLTKYITILKSKLYKE
jgi:hypothetical protein